MLEEGIHPILHVFQTAQTETPLFDNSAVNINYYQPKTGHRGFSFMAPFSISSYYDKKLIHTLNKDQYPILFHGIETTFNVKDIERNGRKIFIRCLENDIIEDFSNSNFNIHGNSRWHDFFSITKSNYENELIKQFPLLVPNQETSNRLTAKSKKITTYFIPYFIGIPTYLGENGTGNFCLFHGDLANDKMEKAAQWLLENIFNEIDIPFVIAGSEPSKSLEEAAHRQLNTCLVANPAANERLELIKKAQLNILPSFGGNSNTHELIQSLIFGRHILALEKNNTTDELHDLIHLENAKEELKNKIKILFESTFTEEEKNKREAFLQKYLNDKIGAEKLINMLY